MDLAEWADGVGMRAVSDAIRTTPGLDGEWAYQHWIFDDKPWKRNIWYMSEEAKEQLIVMEKSLPGLRGLTPHGKRHIMTRFRSLRFAHLSQKEFERLKTITIGWMIDTAFHERNEDGLTPVMFENMTDPRPNSYAKPAAV
jgi:hypothetical protein